MTERRFLPAAGRDIFLPLYDPAASLFGFQKVLTPLVAQAQLQPGHVVLDVGCGTGTLAVFVKQRYPEVQIVGLDPDPKALARAQRKADRAGVSVVLERGFADALPHGDGTFDRVFSSMMFHHLPRPDKLPTLLEIRRVLKPGGRLEFLDFAGGTSDGFLAHILHGHALNVAAENRLLQWMAEAGFAHAKRLNERGMPFGHVAFYQAEQPQ